MTYSDLVKFVQDNTYDTTDAGLAVETLLLYVQGKPLREACKITGQNRESARNWKKTKWYPKAVEMARTMVKLDLDRKFSSIIMTAAEQLSDRLVNGDKVKYKDGTEQRKPLGAYQTALILAIAYDKQALLRGEPINISESISTDERLSKLKEAFKDIAEQPVSPAQLKVVSDAE